MQLYQGSSVVVPICKKPNLFITAFADVLGPNGARSSAGTVLIEKLVTFSLKFR